MPRAWLWVERTAWAIGVVSAIGWLILTLSGAAGARHDLTQFAALHASTGFAPDTSLWSPERIRAWKDTRDAVAPAPLAVLRIPRLKIEVAVLEGTDEWTLNRGVGHIEDTARPGERGNVGLAGHRDGFFRALKDIQDGDLIEMVLPAGVERYQVVRTWLVTPEEVSVLDPTAEPAITLVTCYPFYYIGSAPQRFIVRAVRQKSPGGRS